jgi:sugar (pentulose or hexulose) kinase
MVAELAEFYELARLAGAEAKCLVGAGNAVRHNPVVWQELERRLKLELRLPPHTEEAAAGAALAAARAAGVQPA